MSMSNWFTRLEDISETDTLCGCQDALAAGGVCKYFGNKYDTIWAKEMRTWIWIWIWTWME